MKFFNRIKINWILALCGSVILYYCILFLIRSNFTKQKLQLGNYYLRKGSKLLLKLVDASYEITFTQQFKEANLTGPCIFMSNHLSLMDLPLIYATLFGTIRPLPKDSLLKIPFFGRALKSGGIIGLDQNNPANMKNLYADIKANHSNDIWLWIFPEGGRSTNGKLQPLKKGGFTLARELRAKIIPVGIMGTDKLLPPFTFNLNTKQNLQINVGAPIDVTEYTSPELQKLLSQTVFDSIQKLSLIETSAK